MTSKPLVVVGHLTTSGSAARQQIINKLKNVMSYTQEKEPGVSKYCIAVPQSSEDDRSIYAIEEYKDKAALDSHMASPSVVDLLHFFGLNSTLLQKTTIHNLSPTSSFTRPSVLSHENPYIVFATLTFKPGTSHVGIDGFAKVAKEAEDNEQGTLSYNILEDKDDGDLMKTIEVYESEGYLWDPHAKSQAVKGNMEATKDIRVGRELVFLKMVAGYFLKEG